MKTQIRKTLALAAAFLGLQLFAATPVAVWDGDFTTPTKGSWTLASTGSTITDESITIGTTPITVTPSTAVNTGWYTVIYKVKGLKSTSVTPLATFGRPTASGSWNDTDLIGSYLENNKVWGVWNGAKHAASKEQASSVGLSDTGTEEHTVVVRYRSGVNNGVWVYVDGVKVFKAADALKATMDVNRMTILGFQYNNGNVLQGAVVTKLAVFSDSSDAGDAAFITYLFPSEVVPVAVWDRDFTTLTKGGITLNLNGNALQNSDSCIKITKTQSDASNGVLLSGFTSKAVTVIAEYKHLTLGSDNYVSLVTMGSADSAGNKDLVGVCSKSSESAGVYQSGYWENTKGTAIPSTANVTNRLAYVQDHLGNTGAKAYSNANGSWTKVYDASGLRASNTELKYACIGGISLQGSRYNDQKVVPATGMVITRIAVFTGALSQDDVASYKFPTDGQLLKSAQWGNIGSSSGGVVTSNGGNFAYDSWTINFADATGMYDKSIGDNGTVRLKRIVMVDRPGAETERRAKSITLTQNGKTITATPVYHAEGTDGISIYNTSGQATTASQKTVFGWNEYVLTDNTVDFDTTDNITVTLASDTSGGTGVCAVQPKNDTFSLTASGKAWTPAIQVTGDFYIDYTPSAKYYNQLAGETKVPAETYGNITVGGTGIAATALTGKTELSTSGIGIGGNFNGLFVDENGCNVASHTVAGWFKVDELPASGYKLLWSMRNDQTNLGGYGVVVGSDGTIYVGRTSNDDSPTPTLEGYTAKSSKAVITAGEWCYLSLSFQTDTSARKATIKVYKNGGSAISFADKSNTGCNGGTTTSKFYIGAAGVSVAGFYIDNGVLSNQFGLQTLATDSKYVAAAPFKATVTATGNWSALTWDPAKPSGGFPAGSNFVITNEAAEATLTIDENITAGKVSVVSAMGKDLSLALGSGKTMSATSYDFSAAVGRVTVGYATAATPIAIGGNTVLTQAPSVGFEVGAGKKMTMAWSSDTAFTQSITGSGAVDVTGSILLNVNNQSQTWTLTVKNGGTLKMGGGNVLPQNTATVDAGGTLDVNGKVDNGNLSATLNGGKLTNTSSSLGTGSCAMKALTLNADSEMEFAANHDWGLIGSGYAATTITLNGHTLTKKGAGTFYLINTTVSSTSAGGSICVDGGTLEIGNQGTGSTFGDNVALTVNSSGTLSIASGKTLTLKGLTVNGGTVSNSGTIEGLTVLNGTVNFNNFGSGTVVFGDALTIASGTTTLSTAAATALASKSVTIGDTAVLDIRACRSLNVTSIGTNGKLAVKQAASGEGETITATLSSSLADGDYLSKVKVVSTADDTVEVPLTSAQVSDGTLTIELNNVAYTVNVSEAKNISAIESEAKSGGTFEEAAELTINASNNPVITVDKSLHIAKLAINGSATLKYNSGKVLTVGNISATEKVYIDCSEIAAGEGTLFVGTIDDTSKFETKNVRSTQSVEITATGIKSYIADELKRENPVVAGTTNAFTHAFLGSTSADWTDKSNWRTVTSGVLKPYTNSNYPQTYGAGPYDPLLFDGALVPEGSRTIEMDTHIEGWTPRFAFLNGVHATIRFRKYQDAWFWVDEDSSLLVTDVENNHTVNNDVAYYVAAEDGITIARAWDRSHVVSYYFKGAGTVKYNQVITGGTHTIKQLEVKVGATKSAHHIAKQKLVSFASSSKTFGTDGITATCDNADVKPTYSATKPSAMDAVGTYSIATESDGVYAYVVAYSDTWDIVGPLTATLEDNKDWTAIEWTDANNHKFTNLTSSEYAYTLNGAYQVTLNAPLGAGINITGNGTSFDLGSTILTNATLSGTPTIAAGSAASFDGALNVESGTLTLGANVAIASVALAADATLALNDGAGASAITGAGYVKKIGSGATTIAAGVIPRQSQDAVALKGIEVTEGTLALGNTALFFQGGNNRVTVPLTVTGGTLDMNNAYTWANDGSGWLTGKPVTLGGTTAATVTGGNFTFYGTINGDCIVYNGGNGANAPATFAANLHGSYSDGTYSRNVNVGRGNGADYDLLISGTFGLGGQCAGTTIHKTGEGTVKMTGAFNMPLLAIDAGTWKMGAANAAARATTVGVNGTLDINGQTAVVPTLASAGAITNSVDGVGSLNITSLATITGRVDNVEIVSQGGVIAVANATIGANVKFVVDLDMASVDTTPFSFENTSLYNSVKSKGGNGSLVYDPETHKVKFANKWLSDTMIWLPIGDSITEGEQYMGHPGQGDVNSRGGYRYQLWDQLTQAGQNTRSVGFRTGHSGTVEDPATTPWAYHAAQYGGVVSYDNAGTHGMMLFNVENTLENAGYPDVITVLIGVNDISFAYNAGLGQAGYTNVYNTVDAMVRKLATMRPNSKVLVSTILPAGGSRPYIDPYNAILRDKSAAKESPFDLPNVALIDVNAKFGAYADGYFKGDHLHPNETGAIKVAKAFSGFVASAIADIVDADVKMVNVHNGEGTNVVVRFNKALDDNATATLTIAGTDVNGNDAQFVFENGAVDATDKRVMRFDIPQSTVLTGGVYTATLSAIDTTALAPGFVDIQGTGAAANIDAAYRNGFQRYQTVTLGNGTITDGIGSGDNWAGSGPSSEQVAKGDVTGHFIKRVGYYVELKRPNKPSQFVWVSMNAFDANLLKSGIPTTATGIHKAIVENLQVYGNRGNFTNTVITDGVVDTAQKGIVEFTPYDWAGTDESGTDYPAEMYAGKYGWNDTLAGKTTLKGGMQIARLTGEASPDKFTKFAAETLFAFNNFNCATAVDLGIGSFNTHRADKSNNVSTPVWDWTDFASATKYKDYAVNAYKVKKIEIWVELDPEKVFTADVGANAMWSGLTWTNAAGEEVPQPAANSEIILNPTAAASSLTIDADVAQSLLTVINCGAEKSIVIAKNGTNTASFDAIAVADCLGDVTLGFNPGAASIEAGANTILVAPGTGNISIAAGKKLTVKGSGLVASKVTNNGTLNFEGGTAENPIVYTADGGLNKDLGAVTLASGANVKMTADNNKVYRVTGADSTSTLEIYRNEGAGMTDGTQFRNLTLVANAAGNGFWIERENSVDSSVDLVAKSKITLNTYSQAIGSLSGAGEVAAHQGGAYALTLTPTAPATYSGTSSVAFTIGGTAVQTLSGNYTGALTVNAGGQVVLTGSANPSSIANAGTVIFDVPSDTKEYANAITGDGTVNKSGEGELKFMSIRPDVTIAISAGVVSFKLTALEVEDFGRGGVILFKVSGTPAENSIVVYDNNGQTLNADFTIVDGKVKAKVHADKFTLTPDKSGEFVWNVGSLFDGSKAYTAFGDVTFNTTAYTTLVTNSALVNASAVKLGGIYSFVGSPLVANEIETIEGANAAFSNDVVASSVTIDRGAAEFASITADALEVANATFGAKVVGPSMRFVRLKITETQASGNQPAVAEFRLYRGSEATGYSRVDWPVGTIVRDFYGTDTTAYMTATKTTDAYPCEVGAGQGSKGGCEQQPGCLIDGYYGSDDQTKIYDKSQYAVPKYNKWWLNGKAGPWTVTIEFPYPVATFTGCNFCLSDTAARNPTAWTIEVSSDGKTWTTINNTTGATWAEQFAWAGGNENIPAFLNSDVHPTQIALGGGTIVKAEGNWTADVTVDGAVTNKAVTGKSLTLDTNSSMTLGDGATLTFDLSGLDAADYADYAKHYIIAGDAADWPAVGSTVTFYDAEDRFYFAKDAGGYSVTLKREAKIGTTYYFTLLKALGEATEGQTVTLCTNVTGFAYTLDKNITFDGDVYEIAGAGFSGSSTLTVSGGYINLTNLPESRSLIGGRYAEAKTNTWHAASGHHYVEIAGEGDKYFQIVKGEAPAEEQKAYPVVVNDTPVGTVALTETQLGKIGCSTSSTAAEVSTALAMTQSNDLTKYENLVLGLDGTKTEVKDVPFPAPIQGTDVSTVTLKLGNNVKVDETTGAKVTYKVKTRTGSEWTTLPTEYGHGATATIDLPESGVQYYQFDVIVTPAK